MTDTENEIMYQMLILKALDNWKKDSSATELIDLVVGAMIIDILKSDGFQVVGGECQ